ncbi:MAG TPA: hypothetical protein VFT74_07595 [Isosphaeraceae bacterium]|nr:hypothetical protein [Isosphaeraceae bacterium]
MLSFVLMGNPRESLLGSEPSDSVTSHKAILSRLSGFRQYQAGLETSFSGFCSAITPGGDEGPG